jgi:YfiH family protein
MQLRFMLNRSKNLVYLTIPSFSETGLVNHCFSTRLGGESTGKLKSLNLGFYKGEDRVTVLKNHDLLCSAVGIDYKNLVLSDQVHGDTVYVADEDDRGKGITKPSDIKQVDAIITNKRKVPLITYYADCVPLIFLDPVNKAVGLCHSGWRGTVKQIGRKTVERMADIFRTDPKHLLVGIGPSIGKCCYEVDEPVIKELKKSFDCWNELVEARSDGKWQLDLWKTNKFILLNSGVKEENITLSGYCTACHLDLFYSYRKEGVTGSLASVIELR